MPKTPGQLPAPVPGSSTRAQERRSLDEIYATGTPESDALAAESRALMDERDVGEDCFAQGYAEAVARLRDDQRYRNWWTAVPGRLSYPVYWDGPGRTHLADYLETVGPDGIDVETGIGVRAAGRELLDALRHALLPFEANRAAYRLRRALLGDEAGPLEPASWWDRDGDQLAGESQASEPAQRPLSPASAVAVEVIAELARAEAKFPDQHLPDGTGGPVAQAIGALLKAMCQANGPSEDTWMAVVAEEVGESFAETEWEKLRPELVQVAAMAVRWILDGDSRPAVTA